MDSFQHAHRIAQAVHDPALELQVYVGLSELFSRLQDADKSAKYAAKAYDLSRSLQLGDLNSRHHRAALLQMASALRKQGELGDAHDYCSVSRYLFETRYTNLYNSWITITIDCCLCRKQRD